MEQKYDAVVVGAGPNGLAAAIRLAQAGLSVVVLEANDTIGGGARSAELTLPGFVHDVYSAVHPLGVGSPFFRQLSLESHGLTWVEPDLPLAHPLGNGRAAALKRSVTATAVDLGQDQRSYEWLMKPLLSNWEELTSEFLQPLLHIPNRPLELAQFGLVTLRSTTSLAKRFSREPARALLAGLSAHSFLPLEKCPSAAFGVVLAMLAHAVGWPFPRGGAQGIANALKSVLMSLGGQVLTGLKIERTGQLPQSRVVLLDLTPRQLVELMGDRLPARYRRQMERFRYGPGIFKVDYALGAPIPWTNEACRRAGTVHVCGDFDEVATAEREVTQGKHPERPFVLLAQPTLFDPTRAPQGKHIAWAYCHVPNGSTVDIAEPMENQIERFAPGFRDIILARNKSNCAQLERHNENLIGGSIDGGATNLWQLLARPILSPVPYRVPLKGWYLCSASTPPGAGVHGMCGFHAAEAALQDCFH